MSGLNRLEVMTKKYVVTQFQDLILMGVIGNLVDCFMAVLWSDRGPFHFF